MTAAQVLQRRLEAQGAAVRVLDLLSIPPWRQGDIVKIFYRGLVTVVPRVYDWIMRLWSRHPKVFERITSAGSGGYVRAMSALVADFRPDVVVSTYNLGGQLLGRMRRSGDLRVPLVAYVTDAGAHCYWVADGADAHLAPLPITADEMRALGAADVRVVAPLVDPPPAIGREEARARLGVDTDGPVVLVNGGSWGVGAVEEAAAAAAAADTDVFVLCGESVRLHKAIAAIDRATPIGWTDQVGTWLLAADIVVDNAGGTTCWEALAAERRVILHRPLGGHGRLNAEALAAAGLVDVTASPEQLRHEIRRPVVASRRMSVTAGADAAEAVLDVVACARAQSPA
jgi:UDP-N-acetylglucosamine:LPS N-acetylglucosamine transferase